MNIKNLIGDVPEVPIKLTVENDTIIKMCVAVVMVATIIILISKIFKK